jgi:tape measure domain-containing protein
MANNVEYNIEIDASVTNAAKKIAKAVEGLEKTIKEINSQVINPKVSGKAVKGISKINKEIKKTQSSLGDLASKIGPALAAFGAFELGKGLIQGISNLEQTKVAFNVLTGSVEKGTKTLKELDKFSDVTPFSTDSVRAAGKNLVAFGVETKDLTSTLQKIGDISAGTGKDFNELANIFGKAKIAGTLMGEDINQLTEAGIPIIGEFAKQLGVPESAIKKLASEGQISFGMLEKAFGDMTTGSGKFTDLMSKQSKTLGGQWSTLTSQFKNTSIEVGSKLLPVLKKIVTTFQSVFEWTKKNGDLIKTLAIIISGAAVAYVAITSAIAIYTTVTAAAAASTGILGAASAALNAIWLANPVGIVIAALAALAAAITIAWKKSETFRGIVKGLWEVLKQLGDNILNNIIPIFEGLADIWQGLKDGFSGKGFDKVADGFKKIGTSILTFVLQPLLQVAKAIDAVTGTNLAGKLKGMTNIGDVTEGIGGKIGDSIEMERLSKIAGDMSRNLNGNTDGGSESTDGSVPIIGANSDTNKTLATATDNAVSGASSSVKNITLNLGALQTIETQMVGSSDEAQTVALDLQELLLQTANDFNQTGR